MIIALCGLAGSGKDTCASLIAEAAPSVVRLSFADPLKRFCAEVFGFSRDQLYGPTESRNAPDPRWGGLTPRRALQALGTEWGRAMHPDVWARAGAAKAKDLEEHEFLPVFTDLRFANEAAAVRALGGHVWRMRRPGAGLSGAAGQHPSELAVFSPEMDALVTAEIPNGGTVEALRLCVRARLGL